MKKINILFLIITAFLLSSCMAARMESAPLEEAPAGFGGEVYRSNSTAMDQSAPSSQELKSSLPEEESVERMVIKNADLSIVVEDPSEGMDQIMNMADEMGGYVVSSNIYETETDVGVNVPRARITIRVPSDQFNAAVEQIKTGAGRVLGENITGQDITREYTDLKSRLRSLEMTEQALAEIMDDARTTEDVLAVYNRLVEVQNEIEVIKGQMQYYEQSVAMSAISIDIQANEAVRPLTIAGWQPVGVAKRAIQATINTLKFFANVLIWMALYILPVVLVLYFPVRWSWKGLKRLFGSGKSKKKKEQSEQQE